MAEKLFVRAAFLFAAKMPKVRKISHRNLKSAENFAPWFLRNSINTGFLQLARALRFMFPKIREIEANKNFECLETKKWY